MKIFNFLALFCLLSACSHSEYKYYKSNNNSLDSTYNSTQLETLISPYRIAVDAQMKEVIGNCDSTLTSFGPESALGNFAADIVFEKGMTLSPPNFSDFSMSNTIALINFGGLRAPINKGDISIGSIFELMPFDNTISIVKLSGQAVKEMMIYLFEMDGQPVSNAKFELQKDKKAMSINKMPVLSNSNCYVITSNYLASGGDKMDFLKNATEKWDSGILMRDAFIEHIRKKGTVYNHGIDGRMTITK